MEATVQENGAHFRSGLKPEELGFGFKGIPGFMSAEPESTPNSSFTALLELPPPQALELLVKDDSPAKCLSPPIFPSNIALIHRASKLSVFASADVEGNKLLSASSPIKVDLVKHEPFDSYKDSLHYSSSPANQTLKSLKRKDGEKMVKEPNKKNKKLATEEDEGEKLPYVHVRARRGQATDSHSLAERARREKINARMKLLQELVPGCNKISGTAMVLDEIINHVQALQRQVEYLSMRLAAVNPRIDFNLDALLSAENGSSMDNIYQGTLNPSIWPDIQNDVLRQQQYQQLYQFDGLHQPVWGREDNNTSSLIVRENSPLYHDSSANSASLHSSQLKMEL